MNPTLQDTLLQLFELVRDDPDSLPAVPMDEWDQGSTERQLLISFSIMMEQVQQRMLQLRRAEEQLREREEQYRAIFEATTDGLSINDLEDGRVIEANPALCKMFDYTYEEFINLPPTATIHPDTYHVVDEVLQKVQTGNQFQTHFVALRKDGTVFNAEGRGTPFNYKGRPHLLGSIRDITEQVQAEEQLREKEEQYRSIFEATSDALLIGDLEDGHIVEANPAACKMFGYSYEELIGLPASATTHPDSLHLVTQGLQAVRAGHHLDVQGLGLRKDGTPFYVEARGTPFIFKGKPHLLTVSRDITERIEAEQQLREKEAQYRGIFEATTDGLIISDWNGTIVEVNPAACRMFGYRHEEFIGLSPAATVHSDDLPLVVASLQTIQTDGQAQARHVALRKDGTTFPSEVHGTMFMYHGKPHSLGVVRDITERIEAERQLREREEQYRNIFEATYDGISIIDLDGFFVEVNPAFCSMFGYTREELIGLHASVLAAPEFLPVVDESLEMIKVGRDFQTVGQGLRKDGTMFYLESHSTTFTYKGKPHSLGVSRDITEHIEAEKQLREREEQYRSVFEATSDALCIVDLEGFLVEVNPAFCRLFGYTYEEIIGLHTRILTPLGYLPLLTQALETLKAGGRFEQFETRGQYVRKDGSIFFVEVLNSPFTHRGKPHSLRAIHDITEQVQAQQLLEQRVEERTRELASLLEISHTVASTLQLKPLLGLILDQLKTIVDYTGSAITILEGQDLVLIATRGPGPEDHLLHRHFSLKHLEPIWEVISSGETVIIDNVRGDSPFAQAYRESVNELMETTLSYIRGWMAVPLMLKERVIGMLSLTHSQPNFYTQRSAELAAAIANQAAVAIENARLYEQAQELAAVEERQRLARELHDSVSQALYGISLGVHTAQLQLDRNPKELSESLDYVLELAETALIEMRALIFELRPESLETEGLVTALTKQAAALQARQNIAVNTDLCAEPDLPLKVKQDLYRVAQEALHNTVKHARASKIDLRLHQSSEALTLEVCDNGRGFDTTASFPGHLGMHSMQERVTGLGGKLQIESLPGQGTCIRIQVPDRNAM